MKKYLLPSLKISVVFIVICSVVYPLLIAAAAWFSPGRGNGETISVHQKIVGYANIGQKFTRDSYFWSRPSAVNYNAAGSGGSNKGPSNPEYLKVVKDRIDSFMVHNPGISVSQIPAELVTASGSGLDPDLSPAGAKVQVKRIAAARRLTESSVYAMVEQHVQKPLLGIFGPAKVNVLQLNIALDEMK